MKNISIPIIVLILTGIFSCQNQISLTEGTWRAVLTPDTTRPELELPFSIIFEKGEAQQWQATITNAEERIIVTDIIETTDSVTIFLPVFEGFIQTRKNKNGLDGTYTHKAAGRSWSAPINIESNSNKRFDLKDVEPVFDPSGRWEVVINPGSENPEIQVGEFLLEEGILTGTFLTTLGDYRYLEGTVSGDQFKLSCFDGAHSLLFTARLNEDGDLVDGIFTGGPTWKGHWKATKNPAITLPDATSLTFLKPGYTNIEFSFPDTKGDLISLSNEKFQGKAKIIQIIGSWCPNCMDETRYFAELYQKYQSKGLEIIALCYESDNIDQSVKAIERFKNGTGADYTFVYAGVSNKRLASQTLPMLNRIISYPTSIFIDRDGNIKKIFTGFSGPGTGEHFEKLSNEMESLIEEMI